ncbi:hypothetical protein DXX93_07800 [Thalassotalea euphylliae]|uniref:Manganese transporter n=1 Tax=Thalassotalea euphylliae TaxID=1655234 RepID=A0A3E0TPJ3_9GAMM|nr:putative manganese transporter [Thalassotalea euphylliae]REL26496.1 hypothetical protein DXX93_07800 [Thalassotalea euphylliae]
MPLSLLQKLDFFSFRTLVPHYRRLLIPVLLVVLLINAETRSLTVSVLADAFWQVAVFVAATLAVYHLFADKIYQLTLSKNKEANSKEQQATRQVVIASLLGVLPGCGGAIVVITQYVSGRMGFGAVAAVLTSTMGDAAFLLLAAEPLTGLAVALVSLVVGVLSGLAVNKIHGADFLRSTVSQKNVEQHCLACKPISKSVKQQQTVPRRLRYQGLAWQGLIIPGAVVGLLMSAQVDIAALMGISDAIVAGAGALLALSFIVLWAITQEVTNFESIVAEDKKLKHSKAFQKVALDTNFVTSWVVMAFLSFELVMHYGQFDLTHVFTVFGAAAPLMGVLVGMIPGCGPQIITTSLYLSGAIPLSAQLGNAISNDGDALFPAIALSPKVAIIATLYSAIPALVVAYGYYVLFE